MQAYADRSCEDVTSYGGTYQCESDSAYGANAGTYQNSGYGANGGMYQQQAQRTYDSGTGYGATGGMYQQQVQSTGYGATANGSGFGATANESGYGATSNGAMYQSQGQKVSAYKVSSTTSVTQTVFGLDAFCDIKPSSFPPGTDRNVVECFNRIDKNGNGVVDDRELQSVLSSCNHKFGLRTVHLLMYQFTHSNKRMIGPKEFVLLMNSLQSWKGTFQRFDRDRNGRIDSAELGTALNCLGYNVQPVIINLLVSKFSKVGARCSLEYDNFIECCLTVKGLTETFNAKANGCGSATFCYEEFLINVLPFVVA